jgi:hypothetical protein
MRAFQIASEVNIALEEELNAVRLGDIPESGTGMAQLIDPAGNRNIVCRLGFAERWCRDSSDWKFEVL